MSKRKALIGLISNSPEQKIEALEKQIDAIFEVLAKHGMRLEKIDLQIFPKEFCERIDK